MTGDIVMNRFVKLKIGIMLLLGCIIQKSIYPTYTCTLNNESAAVIVVEFDRLGRSGSGEITVEPKGLGKWDAGICALIFPCSVKGIRIIKVLWQGKEIPNSTFEEKWAAGRPASFTWTMTENFLLNDENEVDRVQLTLHREPAGFKGSTYPGGNVWTLGPLAITPTENITKQAKNVPKSAKQTIEPKKYANKQEEQAAEKGVNLAKGFVPKNEKDRAESCYCYLPNCDVKEMLRKMISNARPFLIHTNGIVPSVYGSSKNEVLEQVMQEKNGKYEPSAGNGPRPSCSHFQSLKFVRAPNGNVPEFMILAAGDCREWKAQLVIAKKTKDDPLTGRWDVQKIITINDSEENMDLWHPGGLDICGNLMAIPIEDFLIKDYRPQSDFKPQYRHRRSKILVFDITDILNPKLVTEILRDSGPVMCVGLTRLSDKRWLIYGGDPQYAEVYISKTTDAKDGFELHGHATCPCNGQNVSFITIGKNGDLYLAFTSNRSSLAPVITGDDVVDLVKFEYDLNTKGDGATIKGHANFIDTVNADCGHGEIQVGKEKIGGVQICNFNAAANIIPAGGIIGIYHYLDRKNQCLHCGLFGPTMEKLEEVEQNVVDEVVNAESLK
jgi:hypothetical protein